MTHRVGRRVGRGRSSPRRTRSPAPAPITVVEPDGSRQSGRTIGWTSPLASPWCGSATTCRLPPSTRPTRHPGASRWRSPWSPPAGGRHARARASTRAPSSPRGAARGPDRSARISRRLPSRHRSPTRDLGSPLLDSSGDVVWTARSGRRHSGVRRTSVFLPAALVLGVVRQLVATGAVDHGWFGIEADDTPARRRPRPTSSTARRDDRCRGARPWTAPWSPRSSPAARPQRADSSRGDLVVAHRRQRGALDGRARGLALRGSARNRARRHLRATAARSRTRPVLLGDDVRRTGGRRLAVAWAYGTSAAGRRGEPLPVPARRPDERARDHRRRTSGR